MTATATGATTMKVAAEVLGGDVVAAELRRKIEAGIQGYHVKAKPAFR
jgi:hypothetical protein